MASRAMAALGETLTQARQSLVAAGAALAAAPGRARAALEEAGMTFSSWGAARRSAPGALSALARRAASADPATLLPAWPTTQAALARAALWLRVGLGSVFVVGGLAKLSRLLDPSASAGIVAQYTGSFGYINQTFMDWLFTGYLGLVLTPWSFLTALSAFELVSGLMLIGGLMLRPLALFWALLVWSFVVSLPVVTTPGLVDASQTYTSPAMLVQIRDITLSGLFFALYALTAPAGPRGAVSQESAEPAAPGAEPAPQSWTPPSWDALGLLIRLSLGATFVVAGFFNGFHKIIDFGAPGIVMAAIGLGLLAGYRTRLFAVAAAAVLVFYFLTKLGAASGVLGYFNAIKRELALFAAALVLARLGGGRWFTLEEAYGSLPEGARGALAQAGGAATRTARLVGRSAASAAATLAQSTPKLRPAPAAEGDREAPASEAREAEEEAPERPEEARPEPVRVAPPPKAARRPAVYVDPVELKRFLAGDAGARPWSHEPHRSAHGPASSTLYGGALPATLSDDVKSALSQHAVVIGKDLTEADAGEGAPKRPTSKTARTRQRKAAKQQARR